MSFVLFFIALIVAIIFKSIVIVPQGHNYLLERFGQYKLTLDPGIHFILPFVENIRMRVSLMETVLQVPSQDVITKDNAVVTTDGIVFFRILEPAKAIYGVENLRHAILNLSMTNLRTVMGSMDLDELLSKREVINARLLEVIDHVTAPWGTKVTRVEIKDIKPPQDIVNSMARQMKAEREKRALVLESEGQRQAAILTAEGEKQAEILRAEAQLDVASKQAEIRERLAQAEANSIAIVAESANEQSMKYFIAQKYTESLKELSTSSNSKIIFLPLETQNLLAPLIGILKGISKEDDNK